MALSVGSLDYPASARSPLLVVVEIPEWAGWLDTAGLFLRFLGHDAVAPGLHSQGVLAGDGTYTAGNGNALLVAVAGAQGPRRVTLAQLECFIGVPKGESHSNCTITH